MRHWLSQSVLALAGAGELNLRSLPSRLGRREGEMKRPVLLSVLAHSRSPHGSTPLHACPGTTARALLTLSVLATLLGGQAEAAGGRFIAKAQVWKIPAADRVVPGQSMSVGFLAVDRGGSDLMKAAFDAASAERISAPRVDLPLGGHSSIGLDGRDQTYEFFLSGPTSLPQLEIRATLGEREMDPLTVTLTRKGGSVMALLGGDDGFDYVLSLDAKPWGD